MKNRALERSLRPRAWVDPAAMRAIRSIRRLTEALSMAVPMRLRICHMMAPFACEALETSIEAHDRSAPISAAC